MNVRLLCPGPSLNDYDPEFADAPLPDKIIGVNRVPACFVCDVWAAKDWPLVRVMADSIIGVPLLLTGADTREAVRRHGAWSMVEVPIAPDAPHQWDLFTSPMAAVWAAMSGATRLDIYGCDLAGAADWDGTQAGERRTEERWTREREIWRRVTAWIEGRGVRVVNHVHGR